MKYSDVDVINIKSSIEKLDNELLSSISNCEKLVNSFNDVYWKATSRNVLERKIRELLVKLGVSRDQLSKTMTALDLIKDYQAVYNERQRCQNEKNQLLNEKNKTGVIGDIQIDYRINQLNIKLSECEKRINELDIQIDYIQL